MHLIKLVDRKTKIFNVPSGRWFLKNQASIIHCRSNQMYQILIGELVFESLGGQMLVTMKLLIKMKRRCN